MINEQLAEDLRLLYGQRADLEEIENRIEKLLGKWADKDRKERWLSEKDAILITYADTILDGEKAPLETLGEFLDQKLGSAVSAIHLLPIYPYTSDDGFSVVDYTQVDGKLGSWSDVRGLADRYELMFDAVVNHISAASEWFGGFLAWDEKYKDYFIVCDPNEDYSKVLRPRALPLLTSFETADGVKYVWTTFSEDQIDLNFKNQEVLLDILDVLCLYASRGARYIRIDAATYVWKEIGTSCVHLPQTHALFRVMRLVVNAAFPGTIVLTEANVPFQDNLSYFGNGNEANMIYQFTLSPLVLHTFLSGDAVKLTEWADSLKKIELKQGCTYFNLLACHDGIGLLPIEGILTEKEKEFLCGECQNRGGYIGYRDTPDGSQRPYEINISYIDALTPLSAPDEERAARMLAAYSIVLSLKGVPGIYIHALLGSRNWREGVEVSGIKRRINRRKLPRRELEAELETRGSLRELVFDGMKNMLEIRGREEAFHPDSGQEILRIDRRVMAVKRRGRDSVITAAVNVSGQVVSLSGGIHGTDLISGKTVKEDIVLEPYQIMWIKE